MTATYYKPSGKFSPISILYFVLTLVIAMPLLALLYSYCIWYIPFVYISFLITIGFGFGAGMLVSSIVVKAGKVRNTTLAFIFGLIGGGIALYFNWAIWVDLVLNSGETIGNSRIGVTMSNIKFLQTFALATQPGALLELIQEINQYGTWSIKGNTVSGTFLYVIWAIEALITLGISALLPTFTAKAPFCEKGNTWFAEQELPAFEWIENTEQTIKDLEAGSSASLSELNKVGDPKVEGHSIFTLYTSEMGEAYLSITNKTAKQNKKGEIEFDSDEIIEYLAIDNSVRTALEAI